MKETNVIWNEEKPKFEDVKGNQILLKWERKNEFGRDDASGIVYFKRDTERDYEMWFKYFVAYAILNTETRWCEWKGDTTNKGIMIAKNHIAGIPKITLNSFVCCPYCTLPIRIIAEPEVKTLKGKLPEFSERNNHWRWDWDGGIHVYSGSWFSTEAAARADWNEFATRNEV